MKIDISDYNYLLEDEKIAKFPAHPRDESKLLIYKDGVISDEIFKNLTVKLPKRAHLIFNDTRVIPARLFFKKPTGATIEVFLLDPVSPSPIVPTAMEQTQSVSWHCTIGNKKKWKTQDILEGKFIYSGKEYTVRAELEDFQNNLVKLSWEGGMHFSEVVECFGNIPLPPYLHRKAEDSDKNDYQTIYSKRDGAVAAPTAGLHFTENVFQDLDKRGIERSFVTLHVSAGTFLPVKEKNAINHEMHSEQIVITQDFLERLLKNHEFVIPVGTTSMRSLESIYWLGVKILENKNEPLRVEKLFPYQRRPNYSLQESIRVLIDYMQENKVPSLAFNTEIMIFPGYSFKICKGLITNFHQPESTLLLLIAALVGEDQWKNIYTYALNNNFRFLSYGDSSLLLP